MSHECRHLAHMTWPEVQEAVESGYTTVVLPLGATQQHGPHLPLSTDTIRADELAERLAKRLPGTLVAPTMPYGCSDEHAGFAGLCGFDHGTLAQGILDVSRRMTWWGIRRVVILSAHGGNSKALGLARELLRKELPELDVFASEELESIAASMMGIAAEDELTASELGIHAGEGETSEMLYLRGDLVRRNRQPGFTGDMEEVLQNLYAGGLKPVSPNGVLGDPTEADAGRGDRYLDAAAEDLASRIAGGRGR